MKSILIKLSWLIYKNKLSFLISWIVLIILSITFIANSDDNSVETELTGASNTEAYKSADILEKQFKQKTGNSAAIVTDKKVDTNFMIYEMKHIFPQIENIFEVKSTKKHNYKLIYIEYKSDYQFVEVQAITQSLRDFVKPLEAQYKTKIYISGNAPFYYDMKDSGKKDSAKGEIAALIFSLVILIFNFGALVSALIPILVGATTIIFSNTVIKLIGMESVPISQVLSSLVGIALSIDYSLFIVSRFKEEIKNGREYGEALAISLGNAGKTIIVSALIMLCSISVLLMPDVSSSRVVVKNLMIIVTISFINSIIFLPIFLIYARKILDKPKFLNALLIKRDNYLIWKRFATQVVNHPKPYFVLSLSILFLLSLPVYNIKLWEPSQTLVPEESESMIGYKLLEKDDWGGELVPIEITVQSNNSVYTKEFLDYIYRFGKHIEANPNVSSIQSITSWNPNFNSNDYYTLYGALYSVGLLSINSQITPLVNVNTGSNITLIKVFPKSLMNIESSHEIIKHAKEFINKENKYEVNIGGMIARARDFTNELYNYVPEMLILIFVSIYIIMLFYMKSVILPLKAAVMNFLPILSSFGVLVLIFQYGYLHNLLGTPINHAVTAMVPITLFCIIFGLSMDYEVLILSRISESYEETQDVKEAVIEGLSRSGSVITGAALILLVVFIPGIFSSSPGIKEICIGIISAIFIDSTVVRLLLVPSFVVLMGKWNWWNPFMKRKI